MGRLIARNIVTQQPQQAVGVDWTNPLTRELQFATFASSANPVFWNAVTGKSMTDQYAPSEQSFGSYAITKLGVGRSTPGGFYNNAATLLPSVSRGKMTAVVVIRIKVDSSSDATRRTILTGGEYVGTWDMCQLSFASGSFSGKCTNGALLTADQPYVVGECYTLAFTNNGGASRQRLYVNGVQQSATGAYASNSGKKLDNLRVGASGVFDAYDVIGAMVWSDELSPAAIQQLSGNPWQVFAPSARSFPALTPEVFVPPSIVAGFKPKRMVNRMQPQQAPVIDWSNPITRGMVSLMWGGDQNPRDLLNPKVGYYRTGASLSQANGATGTAVPLGPNGVYSGRNDWGGAGIVGNQVSYFTVVTTSAMNAGLLGGCLIGGGYGISLQYAATAEPAWNVKTSTAQYSVGASAGITTSAGFNIHGLVYNTGKLDGYLNGRLRATSGAVGTDTTNIMYDTFYGRNTFGGSEQNDGTTSAGIVAHMAVAWNRPLSEAEARSFQQNPWQIFKSNSQSVYAEAAYQAPAALTGAMTSRRALPKAQPQASRRIDWNNAITRGLQMAVLPGVPMNLVDGVGLYPDPLSATLRVEARKGMQAVTSGAYLYPIPTDASAPEAKFDTTVMTALVYAFQPTAQNNNICFMRGNGSNQSACTWGVGLHGGSNNGAIGVVSGTVISPSVAGATTTVPRVAVMKADGANATLYLDGNVQGTSAYTPAVADYNTAQLYRRQVAIGNANQTGGAVNINPFLGLWWNRPLSDVEVKSISANPWQVFKVDSAKFWVEAVSETTGIISANGSSVGASTLTAISAAIKEVFGSVAGVSTAAASGGGITSASGSVTGVATGNATGASLLAAIGSALGTASVSAVANIIAQATGAVAGTSVVGGAARWIFNAAGNSSGAAAGTATAVSITQATGYTVGTGNASASAVSISTSSGASTGTATLAGSGAAIWRVDGSAAGISFVAGTSNAVAAATTDASGNAVGTSVAIATSGKIAGVSGAASGSANVIGQGQTLAQAIAQALGTSNASAGGVLIAASVGAGVGSSNATGTARMVKGSTGASAGSSSAQSVVVIIHESVGMALGASDIEGVSAAILSAVGAANGAATVMGVTEGGVHYTAKGDKFNITLVFSEYAVSLDSPQFNVSLDDKFTMELDK